MPLTNEDVPVRGNEHVIRLIERRRIGGRTGLIATGPAECHQNLSLRAEFENLVANDFGRRSTRRGCRSARSPWQVVLPIGHPDIPLPIDVDSMGKHHQPGTEALHEFAAFVEFQNRVETGADTRVCPAALGNPDGLPIGIDIDGARRSPGSAIRKLRPSLNGLIGIGRGVHRCHAALRVSRTLGQ